MLARVIKNCSFIDWESYLPMLFSRFLNMFEVSEVFLVLLMVKSL